MITQITAANADKYRVLFAKATADLREYDSQGRKSGDTGFTHPVIQGAVTYAEVNITPETYVAGEVWVREGSNYRQTELSEHYVAGTQYYIQKVAGEITSLDEYFLYIRDLMNIDPVYTILPLDEEIFTIDANSRQITVPAAFKKNGVSVQSDVVSEVLYFRIARFYDMEDLTNDDIFIEWRTPANSDGEQFEGVSKPWAIDLESLPGEVVFGWPLSKEITAIPGEVEFSVRFYRYNDETKTLQYSLSTLPAKVVIKAGLNLEKDTRANLENPYAIVDTEGLLTDRLLNSEEYGGNTRTPDAPIINSNDGNANKDIKITYNNPSQIGGRTAPLYQYIPKTDRTYNTTIGNRYDEYLVYLTDRDYNGNINGIAYKNADGSNGTVHDHTIQEVDGKATIRALVHDTGELTYAWIKLDSEGNVANSAWFNNGEVYAKTTDTTFTSGRVYYYKKNSNYKKYTGTASGNPTTIEVSDATEAGLYERYSYAKLNCALEENAQGAADDNWVIGSYQARVTNRVDRKTNRSYGPVIRIPEPNVPVITNNIIPKKSNGQPKWSNGTNRMAGGIFESNQEDSTIKLQLSITAEVDAHGFTYFEWYKEGSGTPVAITLVQNRTTKADTNGRIDVVTSAATFTGIPYTSASYNSTNKGNDGIYKCVVHTLLNSVDITNAEVAAGTETKIRVTHEAAFGTFDYGDLVAQNYTTVPGEQNGKMPITFTPNENEDRIEGVDTLTYQWYKYSQPQGGNAAAITAQINADKAAAEAGTYKPKAADVLLNGKTTLTNAFITNTTGRDDGLYFCIVSNTYNGYVGTQSTRFIEIIDTSYTG